MDDSSSDNPASMPSPGSLEISQASAAPKTELASSSVTSVQNTPAMESAAAVVAAAAQADAAVTMSMPTAGNDVKGNRKSDKSKLFRLNERPGGAFGNFHRALSRAKVGIERMKLEAATINEERRKDMENRDERESSTSGTQKLALKMSSFRDKVGDKLAKLNKQGTIIKGRMKEKPRYEPTLDRITNVENFFRYTEEEGKVFFDNLDNDGDGIVTVEDLKKEMRRRNLPEKYAYRYAPHIFRHVFTNERDGGLSITCALSLHKS